MKNYLSICLLLAFVSSSFGQRTDTELWTGAGLNFKVHPRFTASVDQVFKFNDTISHFKSAYTEAGGKFKVASFFSVGLNYRFVENPPNGNAHRFSGDLAFKLAKKNFPLSFAYRLRYQHEVRISNQNAEDYVRNKFSLNYNFDKLIEPYVSVEPFFRLNGKNEIRIMRYEVGVDWRIINNLHLTGFYRLQKDVNIKKAWTTHILGLMLTYNLRTYTKDAGNSPSIQ